MKKMKKRIPLFVLMIVVMTIFFAYTAFAYSYTTTIQFIGTTTGNTPYYTCNSSGRMICRTYVSSCPVTFNAEQRTSWYKPNITMQVWLDNAGESTTIDCGQTSSGGEYRVIFFNDNDITPGCKIDINTSIP